MIDDTDLRRIAGSQHGLLSFEQLRAAGFGEYQRRRLIDGHRWEALPGRVIRLVGATDTLAQRLEHAVLSGGPDAALGAMTAVAYWGVRGATIEPIHVSRVRDHVDRVGRGVRHQPLLLPPKHVLVLDGIRVVTPARALFDVAGSERGGADKPWWLDRMERLVNNALTDHLVSAPALQAMFDDLAKRGRPGIQVMRALLAKIPPDYVAPASGAETRLKQLCERAGIPPLRRQVNLGDQVSWIGRVDFVDQVLPFVLEVQSERFHSSHVDAQLDAERRSRLDAAGYEVAEVTTDDVWYRPDLVIERIQDGRRRAALRRGASA